MGSTKRVISISVDDDIADFLEKKGNKSAFVSFLVRKAMAEAEKQVEQPEAPEPIKPRVEWTKEMSELWKKRESLAIHGFDRFERLETLYIYLYGSSGTFYQGDKDEYDKLIAESPAEMQEYFNKVVNLPEGSFAEYTARVEETREQRDKDRLAEKCGGDPDEVVWRGLTRRDIMSCFDRNKHYSTQDVASKLGIGYDQAYKHIVPWLRAEGINVG